MTMKIAFLFPGQGSQFLGMGRPWAERYASARAAFEEADEELGFAVSRLCWLGPEEDLQLTANTQPALLTTAVATARVLREHGHEPQLVAGHSLGEYAALVTAGTLDFAVAVTLVRRRGEAMQEAVPLGQGSMAAILGLEVELVQRAVEQAAGDQVCTLANLNAPGQIVIAGHTAAVERAIERCKEAGARRAVLLPVSAPFHCPLMAPARQAMTPLLRQTDFADPRLPVITNIDALPVEGGDRARDALIRQIDGPVRWSESVRWMVDSGGVELFVEVGPGTVLTGLNRRIAREVRTISLSEPEGLEKLEQAVGESG